MTEAICKNVKAVLFDLDGTLVDTLPGLTQLVNQVRQDFDKPPLPAEQVSHYIGKGMPNLIHRSMTESMDGRLPEELFRMAILSLSKHVEKGDYDQGTLYVGVKESLEAIHQAGFKISLVTNKPYAMSLDTLKAAGITDCFDAVVGGDSAEQPKPSAAPVLLACQKLGVGIDEAVMVGDSGNDSQAALNAGVRCILVRTGWSEGIPLEEIAKRDHVTDILDGISDVKKMLLSRPTKA